MSHLTFQYRKLAREPFRFGSNPLDAAELQISCGRKIRTCQNRTANQLRSKNPHLSKQNCKSPEVIMQLNLAMIIAGVGFGVLILKLAMWADAWLLAMAAS